MYAFNVHNSYFQEVLVSTKLSSEDTEIQLHKDGSWSTRVKLNDSDDGSPSKAVQKVEVISDDIGKRCEYDSIVYLLNLRIIDGQPNEMQCVSSFYLHHYLLLI